ncbi:MAG TPA: DUF5610 domain-containing protein [Motiliproteus sp.]
MAINPIYGAGSPAVPATPASPNGPGKPATPATPASPAAKEGESTLTPQQLAKEMHNRQILEAQASLSVRSGDQSLQLTLRAAIDAINERLAPELGPNAIERAQESGLDVSPEATAERIVTLTTAMFSRYQAIHTDMETLTQAESFVDIIRGGIEQGFAEAREILDGLGVLEGDIAANIDRTFELVQEGLNSFLEQFRPADVEADETGA